MDMMDLYNEERAKEALDEALTTKADLVAEIEKMDCVIFILKYFLSTGETLDPDVLGIGNPEGEDEDDG